MRSSQRKIQTLLHHHLQGHSQCQSSMAVGKGEPIALKGPSHQVYMWYLQAIQGCADHPGGLGLAGQLEWKEILVGFNEVCLWRSCSAKPGKAEKGGEEK